MTNNGRNTFQIMIQGQHIQHSHIYSADIYWTLDQIQWWPRYYACLQGAHNVMPLASNRCTFRDEGLLSKEIKFLEIMFLISWAYSFSLQNSEAISNVKLILLFLKVLLMLIFFPWNFLFNFYLASRLLHNTYNNRYK